jgi:hypothetical protein
MKTPVWIVLLLLLTAEVQAQLRLQQVELQAAPGALLQNYTDDALVFERRRNRTTVAGATHFLLQTHWRFAGRWQGGIGLGMRTDRFTMNRVNAVDGLFAIVLLPFGARPFADTLPLEQVKMRNRLLSVPLSFSYDLTARASAPVHFLVRAQLIPSFLLSARAGTTLAAGAVLPAGRQAQLQQTYEDAVNSFSLLLAPEVNMQVRFPRSPLGIQLGLQPLAFDLAQTNSRFLRGQTHLRLSFGLLYTWQR